MLTLDDYKLLYQITKEPNPLNENCGRLCDNICCNPGHKNELGMYLFPGEETMFTMRENWLEWEIQNPVGFPDSWREPVYFLRCTSPCPREKRPLSCRFFPLTPHLQQDGNILLIYETLNLPYKCPLITSNITLQAKFIHTTEVAWKILLKDERIHDLVKQDSRDREENNLPIQVVTL